MGLEKQGSKPSGLIGKIIGRLMNKFHTSLYVDYFNNNLPKDNSKILDIGCGGGEFLSFLYNSNESYKLYGLDHSPGFNKITVDFKFKNGWIVVNASK